MASGPRRKYSPNKNITFRFHPVKQMSQGFYALWEKASALSTPEKYVGILITLTLTVGGCLIFFFPMHNADVYIYHLPIAKAIFNTGFLPEAAGPGWVDATIPHSPLVFIYYGANWLVYGTVEYIIPKMSSFLFGILLLGVVYSIVRELLDSSKMAGLIPILLSLEIQSFNHQLLQENIDSPFSFYCLASFYFVLRGFRRQNTRELILGSVFSAMACWAKYHGIVFVGIFSVLILGWSIYRHYLHSDYANDLFFPSRILKLFWLPCSPAFSSLSDT